MNQLLTYLQSQQPAMLNTLARWVNHDSPTYHKPAVDALGQLLVREFEAAGAALTAVHRQPELGDHYTLTYGQANSQILILGHFDTVWPLGEAEQRPFTLDNGRGLGPGVHDMKAGLVIGLFALKALAALNLMPSHQLVFVLNSDEEIGSLSSRALLEAAGRRSRCCLVLEGSHHRSRLTTSRRGVGRFKLHVTGKAAHSGVEPEKGASAIEELARQIQRLHALNDPARGITVNVGVIRGGERPNIVAAQATAEIDLRVTAVADGPRMVEKIYGLQPQVPGCQLTVTGGITRPPFEETAAGLALFNQASQIATELGFAVEQFSSGGGSDANLVAAVGTPTLDGLGSLGGGAHALTEYVELDSLPLRAALLAELLLRL